MKLFILLIAGIFLTSQPIIHKEYYGGKTNAAEREKPSAHRTFPDSKFKIFIDRKLSSDNCLQGYLGVNENKVLCYTLELPFKNNTKDISSIPNGTYKGFVRRYNSTIKGLIKGWRIELADVDGRDNIQIHAGFWTILPFNDLTQNNTKGCILVGTTPDVDNCRIKGDREAIQKLSDEFNKFEKDLALSSEKPTPVSIEVEVTGVR